jgi:hypothetical protein
MPRDLSQIRSNVSPKNATFHLTAVVKLKLKLVQVKIKTRQSQV